MRRKLIIMDEESKKEFASEELEDAATYERVLERLKKAGAEYGVLEHEPVKTSAEAAAVRGVSLASGAKAMLVKTGAVKGVAAGAPFVLAVMSASRRFSWKLLKKALETKKLSMAEVDAVRELTGCLPGAVPPFGSVFSTPTVVDRSLLDQGETINFNAGLRTRSVNMKTKDYIDIEKPLLVTDFTEAA